MQLTDFNTTVNFAQNGKIIAFPTETVYGLGASIKYPESIQNIYQLKNRPQDNPCILHIANTNQVHELARSINPLSHLLIQQFMPGPFTIVLNRHENISKEITCNLNTVAIRMPSHPIAHKLITAINQPVAATSANLSGTPSSTLPKHILEDFKNTDIALLTDSINTKDINNIYNHGIESTVIQCQDNYNIKFLRLGNISPDQIRSYLDTTEYNNKYSILLPECNKSQITAIAPGMKYRHYAPKATVLLNNYISMQNAGYLTLNNTNNSHQQINTKYIQYTDNLSHLLIEFYAFLRHIDELNLDYAVINIPETLHHTYEYKLIQSKINHM